MRWMDIAWEQEGAGVEEIGGPRAHASIIAYFHQIGRPDITSDEVPWCAAFYFWCLQKAGVDISMIEGKHRLLAHSATRLGTRISGPRAGCACVFPRRDKSGRIIGHHVGFVTGWTATVVTLLGGNQANKVCEADFKRTREMIWIWPPPPATASEIAADGSRTVAAANRQQKDGLKAGAPQGLEAVTPDAPLPATDVPVADPSAFPSPDVIVSKGQTLQGWLDAGHSFFIFAWGKLGWVAFAITLYYLARMAWDAWRIRAARVEDHNTGKALFAGPSDAHSASGPGASDAHAVAPLGASAPWGAPEAAQQAAEDVDDF